MENWDQFANLSEYKEWISNQGKSQYTFKVGIFDKNRFNFDQAGYFFTKFIPDAPQSKQESVQSSVLGEHTYRSLLLNAEHLFEKPKSFIRQGDILKHFSNSNFPEIPVTPTHWIVASQTCTVDTDHFGLILPAYEEPIFMRALTNLVTRAPNPPDAIRNNKKPRFLALPPSDHFDFDHSLIIDLGQSYSVSNTILKNQPPIISMTFPCNAYFSCRLAMFLFRDVENWDDERQAR